MAEAGAGRADEARPQPGANPEPDAPDAADPFLELRALIVGPEQRDLQALQAHVFDAAVQAREVSRVLPDAIALRTDDPQLAASLAPIVEDAITASVHRDPRPLADALFPVMGPAIRKSIEHMLASMMEAFNRGVEQSVSWRALQWRLQSWRTGTPFAEIVLLNTLEYRVEEVFLIHADTGLLLQHVSGSGNSDDADQVSAMLTAIRDFVRDSFKMTGSDHLDTFRVGSLTVVVEPGPYAILASVVRGTMPHHVRVLFRQTIESIHLQFGGDLKGFKGDAAPFARARPALERCLVSELRAQKKGAATRRWIAVGVLALLALGVWSFFAIRERQRWLRYLDRLAAEPGLVVLSSERRGGKLVVSGLRDPLAADPAAFIAASQLDPAKVVGEWTPYHGLAPTLVRTRAEKLLRPPAGVSLAFADGVLTAHGEAPDHWLLDAERLTPALAGVDRLAYDGPELGVRLKEKIEAITVLFPKGKADFTDGQTARIDDVARLLTLLDAHCRVLGIGAGIEILGHTDNDGSDLANEPLSQARAAVLLRRIARPPLDALTFSTRGVGSTMPVTSGTTEADKEQNRRASFLVTLSDAPARGSRP